MWGVGSALGWCLVGLLYLWGRGGGGFMVGHVLARLQRAYWGI